MSRKYSERIRKDTPPICSSNIEQQNCSARKRCNQYGHHRNGDGDDHTGKPDRAGAVEADGGGNILDNRRDAAATAEEDDKDSLEVVGMRIAAEADNLRRAAVVARKAEDIHSHTLEVDTLLGEFCRSSSSSSPS
nr:hypothetical protein Iba_chr01aCG0120 [Ipomoea batatas]